MRVIAEVGSNWTTKEQCLGSIDTAAFVGADVVKFQAFTAEALYGFRPESWDRSRELPLAWLPELAKCAEDNNIEFACTAFSPDLVRAVDPFVNRHKIASSDSSWSPLLEAVWQTGKPILLSIGASTEAEIDKSLFELVDRDVTLMYCEAAYPARWHDLRIIRLIRDMWPDAEVGYSDHTIDIINAPVQARDFGAVILEKHFTAFPDLNTPDREHSLTPFEFRQMVSALRGNSLNIAPSCGEIEFRQFHKRGPDGFRRLGG